MERSTQIHFAASDDNVICRHIHKSLPSSLADDPNDHDGYTLFLSLDGAVDYHTGNFAGTLKRGDLLLTLPHISDGAFFAGDTENESIYICIKEPFLKSLCSEKTELSSCFHSEDGQGFTIIHLSEPDILKFVFLSSELLRHLDQPHFGSDLMIRALLIQLLIGSCNQTLGDNAMPQLHTIAYPEKYSEILKKSGASSFAGKTDHVNSKYYVFNDYYNMKSNETLHILTHFETYQQTREYTCGAACALMVLNWFGKKKYHEHLVGQLIESHPQKGSTVENIADFFDLIDFHVEYHASAKLKFDTIEGFEKSVIAYIDRGIPIMVDWVDWAGHWQVIIGIDTCGSDTPYDDVLIFADPYDITDHYQDGYYIFSLGRFFGMWREGPCSEKEKPYNQPFVIAYPKDYK